MKTCVLLVALLTAAPAYAAPICFDSDPCGNVVYEHAFHLEGEEFLSQDSPSHDAYTPLPMPYELWTIPAFDFSLGIPQVLLVDIEGTVTFSGRIYDLAGATAVNISAIISTLTLADAAGPNVIGGIVDTCTTAPCDFSSGPTPFVDGGYVIPDGSGGWVPPVWDLFLPEDLTLPIPFWSPDTFFHLTDGDENLMAAPITVRTELTGVARATYVYAPVPEPTTMLLLGSGLVGAAWKRRRRQ